MATLGDIVINLRANSSQFVGGLNTARGSLNRLNQSSQGSHSQLGRLAGQFGLVDSRLLALTGTAGLAAGAIAGVGFAAVKCLQEYASYTRELQSSFAIQELTTEQQQRMSDAARLAARDVSASAEQMARGYFFLASAGFDAEQQIAALPAVAAFAQAGNFDLALATDLLTDAQSALGLSSNDAAQNLENLTRVSDVLLGANTLANASAQQFAESLTSGVGAQAKTLGIEVEELTAILAVYADQGTKGADASTLLSIALRDLETKAIQNPAAFAAAGVAVHDEAGEFRSFELIVSDLEHTLAGLSDQSRKMKLMELGFTDKSIKSILMLLGTSDKIKGYRLELEQMAGKTADVADNSLTRLDRATNHTAKAWSDLKFELGGTSELFATPAVSAFATALDVLAFSASGYGNLFRGIGDALGEVSDVLWVRFTKNVDRLKESLADLAGLDIKPPDLDQLDFSNVAAELTRIAGTRDGVIELAGYFAAGQQSASNLVTAFQSVNPELDAAVAQAALLDFTNGVITAGQLREIITSISDEAARFDFAVDLLEVEQIGGAFEQSQQKITDTANRQAELNRAFNEGSLAADEYGRATRAVAEARDQATGGSAALATALQQELELVGLNVIEQERLTALFQSGARADDANRVAGLRQELAIAEELLTLQTQLAEQKFGRETVAAGTRLGVGIDQMGQFAGGDFAGLGLDPDRMRQLAELQEQINEQKRRNEEARTPRPDSVRKPEDRRDRSAAEVRTGEAFSRVLAAMRPGGNTPALAEAKKTNDKLNLLVTKTGDLVRAVENSGGELIA